MRASIVSLIAAVCAVPGPAGYTAEWQQGSGFRWQRLKPTTEASPGLTQLDPKQTGVAFTNRVENSRILENQNLMNGSGLAAGDFDGDGWPDLYICALEGNNALFRNLGGFRFQEVTAAVGVACAGYQSTGAVFADVDGNGRLDLLVSTLGRGVLCFKNTGDGRFKDATTEAGLAARTGSTSLALGDVNGDGTLDLYVANYGAVSLLRSGGSAEVRLENGKWVFVGPNTERLRLVNGRIQEVGEADVLYLNDGAGRFSAVPWNSTNFLDASGNPVPPPLDFGLSVQLRDFNGDRWPDIYVCNDFASPDRMWLNDGTGRFRAAAQTAMRKQSASSMGVDFADLDRDGPFDFFTTEMRARDHAQQMRDILSVDPRLVGLRGITDRPDTARNTLQWNRGDSTFAETAYYAGVAMSDWSWTPVFLDVDLDGYEDLLVGNGMWFNVQDRDTLAAIRGLGKQTVAQSRTNLLLYPPYFSPNVAWRNRGDLTFEDKSGEWGFDATQISQGMACADFDRDGALDVAINCFNAGSLLYRNRGSAPRVAVRLRGKAPNTQGIGAYIRVTAPGLPLQVQEMLCGGRYLSADEPVRAFAAGNSTNRLKIEVLWRSGARSVVTNAMADCVYEIEEAGATADPATAKPAPSSLFRDLTSVLNHAHQDTPFNDYTRQPLLMRQFSQLGPGVAWVDLDLDGADEVVIGAGTQGALKAYRYGSPGRLEELTAQGLAGTAADDICGFAAWVTPAGRPTLLMAQASYEAGAAASNAVLMCSRSGTGLQVARVPGLQSWGASPGPVAVADIDGNGTLEIFVGGRIIPGEYPRAASSRIYGIRGGALVPDAANNHLLEHVGLVSGAVWSDLDLDGFPELLLACEWGPVRVFKNVSGRLREVTQELGLSGLTGWWNGINAGDFDGDGRMDIVACNWGQNDMYRASADHPLRLYYGDMGEQGVVDLVEAYYSPELAGYVPRRTLNALAQAFPPLQGKFSTHAAFARATVEELFSIFPQPPPHVQCATLQSYVFLNREDKFVPVTLPVQAQLAPAFAATVADLDGDGREDLFISQNFFPVRIEADRLDAGRGLLLLGDGKGAFRPLPGQASGIQVYGDQRGAAVGDFNGDGRTDLVVTQNRAETRLFENVGARPGVRIRLKGPRGNPSGVGAVLRLESVAGMGPAREIHAGSGYWSQDSLVQVMATQEFPAKLHVLWPGGKKTVSEVQADAAEVQVDFEGKVSVLKKW